MQLNSQRIKSGGDVPAKKRKEGKRQRGYIDVHVSSPTAIYAVVVFVSLYCFSSSSTRKRRGRFVSVDRSLPSVLGLPRAPANRVYITRLFFVVVVVVENPGSSSRTSSCHSFHLLDDGGFSLEQGEALFSVSCYPSSADPRSVCCYTDEGRSSSFVSLFLPFWYM